MEEKKVPALRFRGFDNAWEQYKLSHFAQRESVFRSSSSEYPSVEYEDVVSERGCLNKDIRLKETEKTGIAFDGMQVLYGKLRPYLHNWLNPDFTGVAVGDWWVLRPVGIDKKFLYRLIQTRRFDEVANQSSGSKMPRADWNLVSNTEFIIPYSLDEQRQIAETFDSLDHLISLHQRKLEMLKKVKKSMLEKMFPKNDAKVPEVRFSDFTDAWEQRRLGELGHTEGGTSIESEFDSEGKYKVISIGSYSEESDYVDQGIRAIESEKTLRRVLQKNDLTMILNDKTSSGKIIGRVLFIDRSDVFVYNQRTEMIRGYEDRYYPKFLYHLLNAPIQRKKIVKQSQGNTQIYVNWSKVSETQYMIPEVGEQTIISNYFSYFDHLISLHQRKLEKLKNIKKSMLEKMFII